MFTSMRKFDVKLVFSFHFKAYALLFIPIPSNHPLFQQEYNAYRTPLSIFSLNLRQVLKLDLKHFSAFGLKLSGLFLDEFDIHTEIRKFKIFLKSCLTGASLSFRKFIAFCCRLRLSAYSAFKLKCYLYLLQQIGLFLTETS